MFKKISFYVFTSTIFVFPLITNAQVSGCAQKNLACIISIIIGYFNHILFLLIGLAVVLFVWNVIKYYIRADADRAEAGKYVMYSLIGFFVMLSLWGLVNILQNTFGLRNESNQPASWTSFKGLFPGGSSSSGGGTGITTPFGGGTGITTP